MTKRKSKGPEFWSAGNRALARAMKKADRETEPGDHTDYERVMWETFKEDMMKDSRVLYEVLHYYVWEQHAFLLNEMEEYPAEAAKVIRPVTKKQIKQLADIRFKLNAGVLKREQIDPKIRALVKRLTEAETEAGLALVKQRERKARQAAAKVIEDAP